MTCDGSSRCAGKEWTFDFRDELEIIDAALELTGIDTSRPLTAPVGCTEDGDGDDSSEIYEKSECFCAFMAPA
ncbi:hypothetical protein C2L64_47055 [Paraburkholderia hospita]|uniref:Uncharacterized protein n=1 Tax=Paraburkholderia hospita TaxID=169430 RepID=A0AAN1MQP2_9BURK|nr:hypothetical protein C2L64_47055 [Paraburkholderia hospita]